MWHDLLSHGLIDEVHLMVGAVVLGGGTPALPAASPALSLVDARRADGDDRVLLRYSVRS